MTWLVLIVSRTEPARYTYLKHAFASDVIDVILDRRGESRRRRQEPVAVEKRRGERRQRDITKDLKEFGWVLARHEASTLLDQKQLARKWSSG